MGSEMKQVAQELASFNLQHFDDHRSLAETLMAQAAAGDTIFLKGSRGLQMEKVLHYLQAELC